MKSFYLYNIDPFYPSKLRVKLGLPITTDTEDIDHDLYFHTGILVFRIFVLVVYMYGYK